MNNQFINENINKEFKLNEVLIYLKKKKIDIIKNIYEKLTLRCTKQYFINIIFVIWIAKYVYYPKIKSYNNETIAEIEYDVRIGNIINNLKNSPLKNIQYINEYSPIKYINQLTPVPYNFNKYNNYDKKYNVPGVSSSNGSLDNNQNELLNRITKIEQQNNKLNEKILKLETQNNKLNERVLKLERENNKLNKIILNFKTEEDDDNNEIKKKKSKMEMDEDIDIKNKRNNGNKCVICDQFMDDNEIEHLNICMPY